MADMVKIRHDPDATGPALVAGRLRNPGWAGEVHRSVYERANAAHPGRFTVVGETKPDELEPESDAEAMVTQQAGAEKVTEADGAPALKSPVSMNVTDALAHAATLDLDTLVAFRDAEAARSKPRSSLLGPLDDMISRAAEGPEEEDNDG